MRNVVHNASSTAVIHDYPRSPGALPSQVSQKSSTVKASNTSRTQPSAGVPMATTANASAHPQPTLTPKKTPPTPSPLHQQRAPAAQSTSRSSTPGSWQHPRLNEVIRRQNASRFDSNNVRIISLNVFLLAASLYIISVFRYVYALQTRFHDFCLLELINHTRLPPRFFASLQPFLSYILYLLRAFFLLNISIATMPLLRSPDACEDIPLTPAQRQLFGLPPMSRPATPQEEEQYVTPPRYSRSATPQSGSSLRADVPGSPLADRGMPLDGSEFRKSVSNSPRPSPLGGSGRSNAEGAYGERRRLSFQDSRGSPRSGGSGWPSEFDAALMSGGTSTPFMRSKASVSLNNKWLYEKGRGSPRSGTSGLSGFGGSGSVFQ